MNDLDQTCRACLTTGVKFFQLQDVGLAEIFGFISGTSVFPEDDLPQSVCYYCCALLLKFKKFRLKCQKSMTFFQDTGQVISSTYSSSYEESKYNIPLTRTKILFLYYMPDVNVTAENAVVATDNLNDDLTNDDDNDWKDDSDDWKVDDDFDKATDVKDEVNIEEVDIKNEIVEENVTAEPLITNKEEKTPNIKPSNKVTKPATVKKTTRKTVNTKDKVKREPKPKKKKCNRYNEKFEEDFADFSKKYNVKVSFLSKQEQIKQVEERKKSDMYQQSRFSCDICYKGFMSERAHSRHMKAHQQSSGAFECEICHLRYPRHVTLRSHARRHKRLFTCSLCGQENTDVCRAKLHAQWHKGLKYKCKMCEKEFKANSTYLNHKRECHKLISCADCGQRFHGTLEYLKHTDAVHGNMKYKCGVCSVSFQSPEALRRHGENSCYGKFYPCRHCGITFPSKTDLHKHVVNQHGDQEGMFTCEQCGAIFTSDRHLSAHFSYNHVKKTKYGSKRDGSKQSTLSRQSKSVRNQSKDKDGASNDEDIPLYLCEVCAKSFSCPYRLKTHMQMHTDEKPFPCSVCSKRFRHNSVLQVHMNTHTGNRPYQCRLCPETFKSYAQRYKHKLLVHTDERPHKCTLCEKTYVFVCDLKDHVKYAHLHQPRPPRKNPRKPSRKTEHKIHDNA